MDATLITPEMKVALDRAKIGLMSKPDSTFFTTLCFSLRHVWSDSIPTAATDGKTIFINPVFFLALPSGQRIFLLVHETLHVALLHLQRVGSREKKKWNAACDYYINNMLIEKGFEFIPVGLSNIAYAGMSSDEIYALLPDDAMPEDQEDMLDLTEPAEEYAEAVKDMLVRASIQSKMAGDSPGSIPGDIQIYLDKLLTPKLPWNRILQKYLQAFSKDDYSFKKLNRRFFPQHYLPSLHSQALMDIAVAADASCSVTDEEFNKEVAEVASIFKMMKPKSIDMILFDTAIRSVDKVKNIRELCKIEMTGRGGTRIAPVIEWANEHKPQLMLVFSDGEFHFPDLQTKVPFIWLIYNNPEFIAPFGKVIHYEV